MKYPIVALALLAAPFASASSLTELPTCAQSATEAGISATGCAISDFACICGNSQFVTSLHNLIGTVCSIADQQVTLAFAAQVCGAVGVSLNIPTPSATSSSVAPTTSAATVPTTSVTDSGSASTTTALPTPSAPYAFANGSASVNGTNSSIPFTGGAAAAATLGAWRGLQLAGSALSVAVLVGCLL